MIKLNSKHFSRKICIETNQQCNLHCIYCYESWRSPAVMNILLLKENLTNILSTKTVLGTIIDFHGGEPFMVFNKIKELCEWTWANNFEENYLFHTTTNGTILNEEIKDWLNTNKERFVVKLSLDGNKLAHDINRCNSFENIDINYFVSKWPDEGVKMTVSPKTLHLMADSVIFLHQTGFTSIQTDLADVNSWDSNVQQSIFAREMDILTSFYLNNHGTKWCSLYDIPYHKLFDDSCNKYIRTCVNGAKIAIDVLGHIYPCHIFFPSVTKCSKTDAFKNHDFSDESTFVAKECMNCPIKALCLTCYGTNHIIRGNMNKRDSNLCEMEKTRIAKASAFHYQRIINSHINSAEDYKTMLALKKILHFINAKS